MEASSSNLIGNWDSDFILISYVCFGIAVLIILIHEIRIVITANEKNRYDYVNQHEIRFFWYAIIAFIAGAALSLTALITPLLPVDNNLKVFVGIFFLAGFVAVAYMVLSSMVRILYPKFLENRLLRIRNRTRKSTAGNRMRKLSAGEGAVHLEEGQLAERVNEIHSIEYDVWLDDKTGEKRVEKYLVYQHVGKCEECGYYTMKIDREEIIKQPSQNETGLLTEHYRCGYCKHRVAKQVVIAALSSNLAGQAS